MISGGRGRTGIMEIFPEKRYNIFPMSAVFRIWPVLARVLWIAAAIALAAPVALAEGNDSRPVSAGEFNRQAVRQERKLDALDAKVEVLGQNVAGLIAQVSALDKSVDKQGKRIDDVRDELIALQRVIIGGLLAGLVALLIALIKRKPASAKSAAGANASASAESQPTATFVLPLAERPRGRPAGRRNPRSR